eukprot:scaffold24619_cov33-Phaeocystis_antarctica.AAC.1
MKWSKAASGSLGGAKQPAGTKLALMMQGAKRGAAAANQAGPQPLTLTLTLTLQLARTLTLPEP